MHSFEPLKTITQLFETIQYFKQNYPTKNYDVITSRTKTPGYLNPQQKLYSFYFYGNFYSNIFPIAPAIKSCFGNYF